jgi:cell division protein FtsB
MNKLLLALNKFSGIDIEALLAKQQELNREIESLKQKLAASSEKNEELETKIRNLEGQIAELNRVSEGLRADLEKRSLQIAALQDTNAALSTAKTELESVKVALESEKSDLSARLGEAEANGKALDAANAELKSANVELAKSNEELKQAKADLTAAQTALTAEKATLESEKTALTARLNEAEADGAALKNTNAELAAANATLTAEKEELTAANANLVAEKAELAAANAALAAEKADLTAANEALVAGKSDLESEKAALEHEKSALTLRLNEAEANSSALKEEIKSLEESVRQFEARQKELLQELENLKARQNAEEAELQKSTEKESLWQQKEQEYLVRLQETKEELQRKEEALQQKDVVLKEKENLLGEQETVISQNVEKLQAQELKLKEQEQNLLAGKEEMGHMQELFKQQEMSAGLLHQKVQDLDDKLKNRTAELERMNADCEQQKAAIAQHKNELEQQANLLNRQTTQLKASEEQLRRKEEMLTASQEEIKSLKQELETWRDKKQQDKEQVKESENLSQQLIEAQSEIAALRQKFVQMETERVELLQQIAALKQQPAVAPKPQEPEKPMLVEQGGNRLVRYGQAVALDYQGLFRGHTVEQEDEDRYPYSREPLFHTEVARWTEREDLPVGLAGKLLQKGLAVLEQLGAGIRVSTRATLPVADTEWGLHPDVLIEWPEKELCVAVLVDAPYDLRTGAAWHSVPSATDSWINYYYTNRGACVVRVAEEQLIEDYEQVLAYLSNYLYEQTGDHRLMQQVAWGVSTPLWSAEGVQAAAAHHYREQYLGRDLLRETLALEQSVRPAGWEQLPFTIEQLPAEYKKVLAFKEAAARKYIVVRTRPYGSQVVFRKDQVQGKGLWLTGVDQIKNETVELPFWQIEEIVGADNIDKPVEGGAQLSMERLQAILADAVCQYHPVAVQYRGADGNWQQTILYWLTFAPMQGGSVSLPYGGLFQDLMTDSVDPESIVGMSALHHRVVRVALRDIRSIRVLDVFVTEREGIGALVNGIYCAVLYQQAPLAELLYNSLPEDVKLMPYAQANYAHLCMLKQEYKKAYAIYTSIDPQQPMQENMTWEDMISNDFTELVKNDVEPELFIRMAHDLNRAGWHFE